MSIELKIKAISLADEARTIRIEEKRAKAKRQTSTLNSLHEHRINVVRPAARATHLARAFLAGMPYRAVERTTRTSAPAYATSQMLVKYGKFESRKEAQEAFEAWTEVS